MMITDVLKADWFVGTTILALLAGVVYFFLQTFKVARNRNEKDQQIKTLKSDIEVLEDDMDKLSAENEWLVAEMHHRVKNNLQVLSSLINSQLSFIDDKAGKEVLFHSKHRLYALSLVHQKLFQHATASVIEMSCCIKEVVDYLADEFGSGDRIRFDLKLVSIKVDADTAISFALIINELVTNSLQYAFPGDVSGAVNISLTCKDEGAYRLIFSDNGVGLPEGFDFMAAKSLGKTLIMGLSKQIRGEVAVNEVSGFEIVIDFKTKIDPQSHFVVCR